MSGDISLEVTLGAISGIQAFISGAVNNPGVYAFSTSSVTLLQALAEAGGVSHQGNLRAVKIQRSSGTDTIDLYDFLLRGTVDVKVYQIRHNNMVFVPLRTQTVSIQGAIKRPAVYEILDHETLDDALRIAGGLQFDADQSHIQIKRVHPEYGPQLIDVDLTNQDAARIHLIDGDELTVHQYAKRRRQFFVTVSGKGVRKPGIYQLAESTTIRKLVEDRVGLYEDATIERVEHIRRNQNYTQTLQLLDLSDALAGDIVLLPEDQINIDSKHDLQGGDKQVHVDGHVKAQGSYILTEGLTLYDVVIAGTHLQIVKKARQ